MPTLFHPVENRIAVPFRPSGPAIGERQFPAAIWAITSTAIGALFGIVAHYSLLWLQPDMPVGP